VTFALDRRAEALDRLRRESFDLLVVGGGIIGSRVALDAARAGLRVALVERSDFAAATSSASSKLVHGGFRYLSLGNFGLVHAAQRERRLLRRHIAPHLVWPMPLVLAVHHDSPHGGRGIALGLGIYAALSGFAGQGRMIASDEAVALVPPLRAERLSAAAVLDEAQTNDCRLTLSTVGAAERAGAVVLNHAAVLSLERDAAARTWRASVGGRPGEGVPAVRARAIVNATGPWLDRMRLLEDSRARPSVRLSKGVHVVLRLDEPWRAGAALLLPDKRSVYAVPYDGGLLLGVTDTDFDGDPGSAAPEPEDVAFLLGHARGLLAPEALRAADVRHSFAGLRVLPPGDGEPQRARRERVLGVGPGGMVSVAGGKLTTHRAIAHEVLRLLPPEVRPRSFAAPTEPLVPATNGAAHLELPPPVRAHLVRLYGPELGTVLASARDPSALEPIHESGPDLWVQVDHAVAREWALTAEDVTRRRTSLAMRGLETPELLARIERRMADAAASAPPTGTATLGV
jgi:glycerol-3-phosphate dehydrogenase